MPDRKKCCIPSCRKTEYPVRYFPQNDERLQEWLVTINCAELNNLPYQNIRRSKFVCSAHFEKKFLSINNRLCQSAKPTLNIAGLQIDSSSGNVETHISMEPKLTSLSMECEFIPIEDTGNVEVQFLVKPQPSTSRAAAVEYVTSDEEEKNYQMPKKRRNTADSLNLVAGKRQEDLTSNAKMLYRSAVMAAKRAARNALKVASLKQRLKMAENFAETHASDVICRLQPTAQKFFNMKLRAAGMLPRERRFNTEDEVLCLSLFKKSGRAYTVLQKFFDLPSKRLLDNVLSQISLKTGINKTFFESFKKRIEEMPPHHRMCTVLFDEMSLSMQLTYDEEKDALTGLVDNGLCRFPNYADHALVFMARGIIKKWKQPVAYTLCCGRNSGAELKRQLKEVISVLLSAGCKVIATVCDQTQPNENCILSLVQETRQAYARQGQELSDFVFKIEDQIIVPLYDPPHLLKDIRNNFFTKNLKYTMDGVERIAKWEHVIELYNKDQQQMDKSFRGLWKITSAHINPTHGERMKVSFCTQIFSHQISTTMGYVAENSSSPLYQVGFETGKLLAFFDSLFDSVNSSCEFDEQGKVLRCAVTLNSKNHFEFWDKAVWVLSSMVYVDKADPSKTSRVPSLDNWILTIRGFQLICKNLLVDHIKYLALRNFNQDPLENFFGSIRRIGARNVNPSCFGFVGAYKTLLVNNLAKSYSSKSNCQDDNCEGALGTMQDLLKMDDVAQPLSVEIPDFNISMAEESDTLQISNYCCGWVLKQIKKIINCENCNAAFEIFEKGPQPLTALQQFDNKQRQTYASISGETIFIFIKNTTTHFLKNYPHTDHLFHKIKLYCCKHLNFDTISCEAHRDEVQSIFINKVFLVIVHEWIKSINNILKGKLKIGENDTDPMKKLALQRYNEHLKLENSEK